MTIDERIKYDKLQYDINKEAAKISSLLGKLNKYEYLTGEEILLLYQSRLTKQTRFTYSPF